MAPVACTVAPRTRRMAEVVRNGYALKPASTASRPADSPRPQPSVIETQSSTMPGTGNAAACMLRPPAFTVTMLPWLKPSRRIVGTDISNALSHVIFVTGSGSSCNQPLLAKHPSNTRASFMKHNSTLASRLEGCASASVLTARAMSLAREETFTLVIGLPAIIPVSSHVRHDDSNVEPARPLMAMCVRRTIAYPS